MTDVNTSTPEQLSLGAIRDILGSPGPCLTMVLSAYHPGEPCGPPATVIKTGVQDAGRQLAGLRYPQSLSATLLQPIEGLLQDPALLAGSHWARVIFRSPDVFCQFRLTQPASASLAIAGCFAIRRFLSELCIPELFYILALSKESVQLFRCNYQRAEAIELPPGVPATLAEAMAFEPPDHTLENRSSSGPSTDSMPGVSFGAGSSRETKHAHLADFYKVVDRGIHKLLHETGAPLLLAGVDQETAAWRAVSTYKNIVRESLPGSPNLSFQDAETLSHACSLLIAEASRCESDTLMDAKECLAPAHFSTGTAAILQAAFEGRVSRLFLNERAEETGLWERGDYLSWGKEDLLNLAAVQALIHDGKACSVPGESMPNGAPIAAIMRF